MQKSFFDLCGVYNIYLNDNSLMHSFKGMRIQWW